MTFMKAPNVQEKVACACMRVPTNSPRLHLPWWIAQMSFPGPLRLLPQHLVNSVRLVTLSAGADDLNDGTNQLTTGAEDAQAGACDLQNGIGKLDEGSSELATGLADGR